jgi:hypothetical protein
MLLATLLFGIGIGIARIVQGGHFLSDVVWSGGMNFLVFLALFYALRMHREPFYQPRDSGEPVEGRVPRWVILLSLFVVLLGLGIFSVATPYHGRFLHSGSRELFAGADRLEIVLKLATETAALRIGDSLEIEGEADGFGIPGSAIKEAWRESLAADGEYSAELKQRVSGFFSELDSQIAIEVPMGEDAYVKVVGKDTALTVDLRDVPQGVAVEIRGLRPDAVVPEGFTEIEPGVFRRGEGRVTLKLVLETGDWAVEVGNGSP